MSIIWYLWLSLWNLRIGCQLNKSIIYNLRFLKCFNIQLKFFFLQVLNLDGNYIKELSKDSFSSLGLIHLKKISLKDCKLQRIDEDAFSQLKVLAHVYLDNNNITKLPTKLFSSNDRLQAKMNKMSHWSWSILPDQNPEL